MIVLARIWCLLVGHDWETNLPSRHSWCRRCKRYDDHPAVVRAEAVASFLRRWLPFGVRLRRRDLNVTLGWPWVNALPSLHGRLHFGWNAHGGELPGLHVSFAIWRLRMYSGVGAGWQDEDGNRSFAHFSVTFETYGIPNLVCLVRGHRPEPARLIPGFVSCVRCDQSLELADVDPRKAAAA